MDRIILDFSGIETLPALHAYLKEAFHLPDYYGCNMDALWDCLDGCYDESTTIELRNIPSEPPQLKHSMDILLELFHDLQEQDGVAIQTSAVQTAYFAGGCFWCITPTFREIPGVLDVVSGYSGGEEAAPAYEDVKHQRTGHRETIRIDFDPNTVSFDRLLDIFLGSVDPFDPDGQFIDRGHSYTLAVYYLSDAQQNAASAAIRQLENQSGRPVYISVEPFRSFYSAEEEHQNYDHKHPEEFRQELISSGRMQS